MTAKVSELLAGRFIIEREVGRGGVGVVYRAHDHIAKQTVALKVIALPPSSTEVLSADSDGQFAPACATTGWARQEFTSPTSPFLAIWTADVSVWDRSGPLIPCLDSLHTNGCR